MPNLKDIHRRIRSVAKTQQITRAMQMVAAAKLRRAQDAIIAARPYADKMYSTMVEVGRRQKDADHPLFEQRDVRNLELVVITSDRGLCGSFNTTVLKYAREILESRSQGEVVLSLVPVGRKAEEYFRRHYGSAISREWIGFPNVTYQHAVEISEYLTKRFVSGEIDEAILIGSEFVSALSQNPRSLPLLPVSPELMDKKLDEVPPYEIEPNAQALLTVLVPRALEFTIYRALLESQAGEHAARMTSMESATRNTEELISSLTLQYNRARQAAITRELVEIVTGAQALEG